MSESPKLDAGKPPVALVVPQFILGIAQVMGFGAKKYPAWSWTRGKEWSRDYSAVMRHVLMFWAGQDLDPESGLHHLLHAGCDIMFLFVSWLKGLGTDDRHKFPPDVLREMDAALRAVEKAALSFDPATVWRADGCPECGGASRAKDSSPRHRDYAGGLVCWDCYEKDPNCINKHLTPDGRGSKYAVKA